jgi:hypothetical protein
VLNEVYKPCSSSLCKFFHYCVATSCVSHEGELSEFIEVRNGVRQGYILSPTLFLLILDRVMKRMKGLRKRGIQWSMKERREDLDCADDICLLAQRFAIWMKS